ncbi:MAG TPA: aminoglycoside adenylyltransferase domain-containing protein [Dehalococcoidia bacterium]
MSVDLPPEVAPLIDALLAGFRDALGDNIVGVYLRGSLALGGFDPATSDVDLLVVTERQVSEAECGALAALHGRIPPTHADVSGRRYEVSYIDKAAIKRFRPDERCHPRSGDDAPFEWYEHRQNWMLERWAVREHGVILVGPDPKTLIDPITPEEIREAVASELRIRVDDWASGEPTPVWLLHRGAQVFEVETVCRALHTLSTAELRTKAEAVAWAKQTLPAEWQPLIAWSQNCRGDLTRDTTRIEELRAFARWGAAQVGSG